MSQSRSLSSVQEKPLAVVTCGPAWSAIDRVRRITNFSTGALGRCLTEKLLAGGWEVACFRGMGATDREPEGEGLELRSFATNQELAAALGSFGRAAAVRMVFHAAALTDFEVCEVTGVGGQRLSTGKIPSVTEEVWIRMRPANKVLPELGKWFPAARVVGWKFEEEGDGAAVKERGMVQMRAHRTALCVLNGSAYGAGFGVLSRSGECTHFEDREALCEGLLGWANRVVAGVPGTDVGGA